MAVYDCFTFYDEFKILELRMKLLDPYVDYFVIAELPSTHRGVKKPLLFKENRHLFSAFEDKVIYVTTDYIPEYRYDGDWSIENWQRNCIMKGLVNCIPDDIVMISDVDEIPNTDILAKACDTKVSPDLSRAPLKKLFYALGNYNRYQIKNGYKTASVEEVLEWMPVSCSQRLFYYYLNCESVKKKWIGTVISKYKNMSIPQGLRNMRYKIPTVMNGGWHFSYIGGVEKVKSKLNSIIDDRPYIIKKMERYATQEEYIIDCMRNGRDIYGRKDEKFRFIDINEIGINIEPLIDHFEEYILV